MSACGSVAEARGSRVGSGSAVALCSHVVIPSLRAFSRVFSLILELSVAATLPAVSGALELPSEENAVRGLRGCLLNLLQNFLPSDLLLVT